MPFFRTGFTARSTILVYIFMYTDRGREILWGGCRGQAGRADTGSTQSGSVASMKGVQIWNTRRRSSQPIGRPRAVPMHVYPPSQYGCNEIITEFFTR